MRRIDRSATDEVGFELELMTEAACDRLEDSHAFVSNFRTDAVTAEDDDLRFDSAHAGKLVLRSDQVARS